MIARSFRYYVEGILAVFYGKRVLLFLRDNGLVILSIAAAAAILIVLIYTLINRRNPNTKEAVPEVSTKKAANGSTPNQNGGG
jgi:hypothetical protein